MASTLGGTAALVTGASSGIGAATARQLAEQPPHRNQLRQDRSWGALHSPWRRPDQLSDRRIRRPTRRRRR